MRRTLLLTISLLLLLGHSRAQADYAINFSRTIHYQGQQYKITLLKTLFNRYDFRIDNPAFKDDAAAVANSPLLALTSRIGGPYADSIRVLLEDTKIDSTTFAGRLSDWTKKLTQNTDAETLKGITAKENDYWSKRHQARIASPCRPSPLYAYLKAEGASKATLDTIRRLLTDTARTDTARAGWTDRITGYFANGKSYIKTPDSLQQYASLEYQQYLSAWKKLVAARDRSSEIRRLRDKQLADTAGADAELKKAAESYLSTLDENIKNQDKIISDLSCLDGTGSTADAAEGSSVADAKGLKELEFNTPNLGYYTFQERFTEAFRKVSGIGEGPSIEAVFKDIKADNPDDDDKKDAQGTSMLLMLNELNAYLATRDDIYGPDAGRLELTATVIPVKDYNAKKDSTCIQKCAAKRAAKKAKRLQLAESNKAKTDPVTTARDPKRKATDPPLPDITLAAYKLKKDSLARLIKSINQYQIKIDSAKLKELETPEPKIEGVGMKELKDFRKKLNKSNKELDRQIKEMNELLQLRKSLSAAPSTPGIYSSSLLLLRLLSTISLALPPADTAARSSISGLSGTIQSVQVEFKDGNIERIQVVLLMNKKTYVFSNNYPIRFSTESDYKELGKYHLFNRTKGGTGESYGICLNDFLQYIPYYRSGRRDFSPADGTLQIEPKNPTNILSKGRLADIVQAAIYTDFAGIVQEKNPNGLVQLEVQRKFPLSTRRRSSSRVEPKLNWGWFSFITPHVTISKIEKNNRNYPGTSYDFIDNNAPRSIRYITPTALLNYSNTNVGVKLNLFTLDLKQIKSEIQLNTIGNFGLTNFADSTNRIDSGRLVRTGMVNVLKLPYFTWTTEAAFEYQGDERFGLRVNGGVIRPWITNNDVYIVSNLNKFQQTGQVTDHYGNSNWMFNLGFKAWINPANFAAKEGAKTNGGTIFFRTTFTQSFAERTQKFYQLQLGYAYDIFAIRSK